MHLSLPRSALLSSLAIPIMQLPLSTPAQRYVRVTVPLATFAKLSYLSDLVLDDSLHLEVYSSLLRFMYFQFSVEENIPLLHTISIWVTVVPGCSLMVRIVAPIAMGTRDLDLEYNYALVYSLLTVTKSRPDLIFTFCSPSMPHSREDSMQPHTAHAVSVRDLCSPRAGPRIDTRSLILSRPSGFMGEP
jgi:hypothetical protein